MNARVQTRAKEKLTTASDERRPSFATSLFTGGLRLIEMQTHTNDSHSRFIEELRARAEVGKKSGNASITAGAEGERELAKWNASNGMQVVHRPDDPQGILRISIGGGGDTPVPLDYCTIRGGVGKCIALLESAIVALRESPE